MSDQRPILDENEKRNEQPAATREPLFRRYQIKIKAGLRVGAVPTGHWPVGY